MNLNYIDIDFPEDLAKCFAGGIEFSTNICTTKNKLEIRNANWQEGRYKYDLLYKKCNEKTYNQLQSFFMICSGCQKAFNFFDKNDYKIKNQLLSTGDGHTKNFEIYKNYSYKNFSIKRRINKVKNVKIYINNHIIDDSNYYICDNILTFTDDNTPAIGEEIYIDCIFYVIVRFANDFLSITKNDNNLIELPDVSLIEVKK